MIKKNKKERPLSVGVTLFMMFFFILIFFLGIYFKSREANADSSFYELVVSPFTVSSEDDYREPGSNAPGVLVGFGSLFGEVDKSQLVEEERDYAFNRLHEITIQGSAYDADVIDGSTRKVYKKLEKDLMDELTEDLTSELIEEILLKF